MISGVDFTAAGSRFGFGFQTTRARAKVQGDPRGCGKDFVEHSFLAPLGGPLVR